MRLVTGAYEDLLDGKFQLETTSTPSDVGEEIMNEAGNDKETGKRIRIASSKYWDVIMYVLPKGA